MDFFTTPFLGIKTFLTTVGGLFVLLGASVEPSVGIWVVSVGGSLLTVALGKDQSVLEIFGHLLIGLFCGIFGSQIFHGWWPVIPQIAASFFLSMFGVNITSYIIRNLETTSFTDMVIAILDKAIPWKKKG